MFNPIDILPVRERIASELRNAIFSGQFAAGQELGQDHLANLFGVSRMPVREALQILSSEGLIKLRANRGAIVQDISTKYIKEHFEVRLILECEAVAKACLSNTVDIERLETIHTAQKKAIDSLDMNETNLCNQSFHMTIWEGADNSKIKAILIQLWNGLSIGTVVNPAIHANKSYEEHGLILKAIKEHQPDMAKAVMKQHIMRSMENMILRKPLEGSTQIDASSY